MHALSLCRPAGLNVDGGRGLRARYLGADGDGGHLGDLRRAKRTSFLLLLGRGGRWEEREGRVGATGDRGRGGPGTGRPTLAL